MRRLLLSASLATTLSACVGTPPLDVALAKQQLERGETQKAQRTLEALSARGFDDARYVLARLHMESDNPVSLRKSLSLLEASLHTGDRAKRDYARVLSKLAFYDNAFVNEAHQALKAQAQLEPWMQIELIQFEHEHASQLDLVGEPSSLAALIKTGELSDEHVLQAINRLDTPSLYAEEVKQICQDSFTNETAYYCLKLSAISELQTGNADVKRIINTISSAYEDNKIDESQAESLFNIFASSAYGEPAVTDVYHAAKSNGLLTDALLLRMLRYEIKTKYVFSTEELEHTLIALGEKGYDEAYLLLGKLYSYGLRVSEDPWLAEQFLLKAPNDAQAHFRLGLLYLSGKLGQPELQKGLDALLFAARHGYSPAYKELIKVFSGYEGVKPNPIYAHAFAEVYTYFGGELTPATQDMLSGLSLSEAQKTIAKQTADQEIAFITSSQTLELNLSKQ
ncbi:hypothetical protein OE749_09400 [Aestuariibacter sp. AA17]|uniref:Sel1 repeat n=1 Tax=Fluctibacter corallii TaxID=2984329 RepID=A0ABT3A8A5_9ALTE|nr:hypothetical protein [Aestuariibacter sp. AA17]MCV2884910.1 hypothetical protein [Aestuariibacter sp. AA17]